MESPARAQHLAVPAARAMRQKRGRLLRGAARRTVPAPRGSPCATRACLPLGKGVRPAVCGSFARVVENGGGAARQRARGGRRIRQRLRRTARPAVRQEPPVRAARTAARDARDGRSRAAPHARGSPDANHPARRRQAAGARHGSVPSALPAGEQVRRQARGSPPRRVLAIPFEALWRGAARLRGARARATRSVRGSWNSPSAHAIATGGS